MKIIATDNHARKPEENALQDIVIAEGIRDPLYIEAMTKTLNDLFSSLDGPYFFMAVPDDRVLNVSSGNLVLN